MDPRIRRKIVKCVKEICTKPFEELCNEYDVVLIDWASIVYGLKNPLNFLINLRMAEQLGLVRSRFIIVVDYSKEVHRQVFDRKFRKYFDENHVEYVLAEDEPAEIKAAKMCKNYLDRGLLSIVVTRDYDPLLYVDYIAQPFRCKYKWNVKLVCIDRKCLEDTLKLGR